MNKANSYTNAPPEIADELKNSVAIDDFLPSPATLANSLKKQQTIPVTITPSKPS